ncbi:DNA-methyltransferase [Devosia neptuniae]|uniref:DNA-methyltransferase n=1 Tax=Devosia neptuniae TaxID=191302 RepID=UPI0022AFCB3D|nr:site-specific DNA-methyltransferase [Devosia neptuniae]MCZ4346437.1 site-specific DNA-methyltransferase [Devosia neptuniae]
MARPKAPNPRDNFASIRLTAEERADMEGAADEMGFTSLSEYVRYLHHRVQPAQGLDVLRTESARDNPREAIREFHKTALGTIYHGNSLSYLHNVAQEKSVDLIMTSPPFGLVRKKSYGNEDANWYCDWFRPFAEGFRRVLKDDGSLVIDIGGAWMPGKPTRSLYHFKLLVMLVEEFGFHLCQEHYWWNPSKLPTPAEWVNIRRVRVKDAVNTVWWLSPTPFPKANNRRILAPYSSSMKDLLKNGYTAKLRPSGHNISDKFSKDNGGSVPPNLLAIANTESNGTYQDYCRAMDLPIHPARFPSQLPEYFIRFLTSPGDLVVDPFGGSCVSGAVAESMGRRWSCIDLSEEYLKGAIGRFSPVALQSVKDRSAPYTINQPCALPVNDYDVPLVENGGRTRSANMANLMDEAADIAAE